MLPFLLVALPNQKFDHSQPFTRPCLQEDMINCRESSLFRKAQSRERHGGFIAMFPAEDVPDAEFIQFLQIIYPSFSEKMATLKIERKDYATAANKDLYISTSGDVHTFRYQDDGISYYYRSKSLIETQVMRDTFLRIYTIHGNNHPSLITPELKPCEDGGFYGQNFNKCQCWHQWQPDKGDRSGTTN
jgi:hypothetical protein